MSENNELKFLGYFNIAPDPLSIGNTEGLTRKCLQYLQGLEIRAEEARGDARWYDLHAAQILGVTERTIRNWKKELSKRKLIGTCTKRVFNLNGQPRTIQVFRCWRVVVRYHFEIRTKVPWKTDIRPEITNELTKNIDPKWLVRGTTIVNTRNGTRYLTPFWKDLLDLARLGLWNMNNHAAKQSFLDLQMDWHPTALKVLGYPLDWKMKKHLNWTEAEIEEYESS